MSRPHHPAIEQDGVIIPYAQATGIVSRYAGVLAREGIGRGDRVGLSLSDTPAHLLFHYAVAWLGATIVPIDFRWKTAEKAAVSRAFGCKIVVIEADDPAIPMVPALTFDPSWQDHDGPEPAIVEERELPVVLSLSSGTTGRPTGALVSHGQLYERFISQWVGMGFNASDRYLLATPLYFGGGRSFAMSMLAAGGTVVVRAPNTQDDIIATVRERAITSLFLVPTQIGRLLDAWEGDGVAMPGIRCLVTSGAAMHPGDRRRVIERLTPNLTDYYATSEGGGIAVLLPHEQLRYPDTVGRAAFRVEIQVVDDGDAPLPAGEVGRLRYRGPGVLDPIGRWRWQDRRRRSGRLVCARRSRTRHAARTCAVGWPHQGRGDPRRRQHLPGRDRGGPERPSGRRRSERVRRSRSRPRRGGGGRHRLEGRAILRHRRASALCQGPAGLIQGTPDDHRR